MRYAIVVMLIVLMLTGCRAKQSVAPTPTVTLEQQSNVQHERVVETRLDTVRVYVTIPEESHSTVTADSLSHLETDMAESDAWINLDGTLGHTLRNKPQSVAVDATVASTHTTDTETLQTVREVPVEVPAPYPVEKELTGWQRIKIGAFWYLIAAILAALGWIFRKPLIFALRKCF